MNYFKNALIRMSQTRWNYWMGFIFDALIVGALFYIAFSHNASLLLGIVSIVTGIIFFTAIEYFVHAKLFHGNVKSFVAGHAKHHRQPMGYDAMPFFFAMVIISPFYLASYLVVSFEYASLFTAGIFIGYIAYGIMHHLMHRATFKNAYFRYMVAFHDLHHERPQMNHGVTVPFWDMVFGTYTPVSKY